MNTADIFYLTALEVVRKKHPNYSETVRKSMNVWYRMVMCNYLKNLGISSIELERVFHKHHSTIQYYLTKYGEMLEFDKEFKQFNSLITSLLDKRFYHVSLEPREELKDFDTDTLIDEIQRRTLKVLNNETDRTIG